MINRVYIFFILLLAGLTSKSQDYALTQFYNMPVTLNPAYTGLMDQYVRISSVYKTQWRKFAPYYTYGASVDGAIIDSKEGGGDFYGLGLSALFDQPDSSVSQSTVSFSFAYHKQLKEIPRHYLIAGASMSGGQRMLNNNSLWYGTFWEENNNYDPMMTSDFENISIVDFCAGIMYSVERADKYSLNAGISVSHITRPNLSFLSGSKDLLYRKLSVHLNANEILLEVDNRNHAWGIAPKFLAEFQGKAQRYCIGNLFKYIMNLTGSVSAAAGVMYNASSSMDNSVSGKSIAMLFQFEYNNVFFGYSHDFNVINFKNLVGEVHSNELSLIINFTNF